jgi:hypothetical protein
MAIKELIVDDIDGETDAIGDLTFFVDGQEYSVDLNQEHMEHYKGLIAEHRAMLLELAEYGRPLRRQAPLSAPRGRTKDQLDEIRRWARANGHEVKDMGRIPDKVIDAYETRSRMPEKVEEVGTNEGE